MATAIVALTVFTGCNKLDRLDKLTGVDMWSDDIENGYYINGSKAWDLKTFVCLRYDSEYGIGFIGSLYKDDYMEAKYYDNNIFPESGDYLCSFCGSVAIWKGEIMDDGNVTESGKYWGFRYVDFLSPRSLKFYKAYKDNNDPTRSTTAWGSIDSEMKIYAWDEETKSDGSTWYDMRVRILIESGDESGSVVDIVYRGKAYEHPEFRK